MLELSCIRGEIMKSTLLRKCSKIARIFVIMFLVVFVQTSSNTPEVKVENDNLNKTLNLTAMALKIKEDIANDLYSAKDTFVGDLTGYGADCPLCSGKLACMPELDVLHGNVNYLDSAYGNVRIVASSKNLPCGTIVRFNSSRVSSEPVIAIVLDRGVLGKALDLLTPSEEYAGKYIGRQEITYDVLRNGWGD